MSSSYEAESSEWTKTFAAGGPPPGEKASRMGEVQEERGRLPPGYQIMETHAGGTETGRRVVRYIASGAFGDVYETVTNDTQVHEAMKIVTAVDRKTGLPLPDKERIRRLRPHLLEARVMLQLGRHPNLVGIRGAFRIGNDFFFFEDLVPGGRTLKAVLEQQPAKTLSPEQANVVALKMARGLAHMHDRDHRHWDVKPDNVLVDVDSAGSIRVVKLTDFGQGSTPAYSSPETLALLFPSTTPAATPAATWTTSTIIATVPSAAAATRASRLHGAESVAAASQDQWSLAVVLVEMQTGRRVASAADVANVDLGEIGDNVLSCLANNPLRRPTMRAVVDALVPLVADGTGNSHDATTAASADGAPPPPDEPDPQVLAQMHNNIGEALFRQTASSKEDFDWAEEHLKAALRLVEGLHGEESKEAATSLNNLAGLLSAQGKYSDADPLFRRALEIRERALGHDHPDTATSWAWIGDNLKKKGDYDGALPILREVVESNERALGKEHPTVASSLNNLAGLLSSQGLYDQAKSLYKRANFINESALGPEHPNVAPGLNNLAGLLEAQGLYEQAKPLYERSLEIRKKALGEDHPAVATALNNLAELLRAQGDYAGAKPLYERAIEIGEKTLGPNHPNLAIRLNNLAGLLSAQGEHSEALDIARRAAAIFTTTLGPNHPHTQQTSEGVQQLEVMVMLSKISSSRLDVNADRPDHQGCWLSTYEPPNPKP